LTPENIDDDILEYLTSRYGVILNVDDSWIKPTEFESQLTEQGLLRYIPAFPGGDPILLVLSVRARRVVEERSAFRVLCEFLRLRARFRELRGCTFNDERFIQVGPGYNLRNLIRHLSLDELPEFLCCDHDLIRSLALERAGEF